MVFADKNVYKCISKQTSCKTEWEIKNGLSRDSFGHNAHITFLEKPSSGTLIIKRLENQIIKNSWEQ